MDLPRRFGQSVRAARLALDVTQQALAEVAGISRSFLSRVELGTANPSLDVVERLGAGLGQRIELTVTLPTFLARRDAHDLVHARCVAAIARRLTAAGWEVRREVGIGEAGMRGWIDLLAFHDATRTLLLIEVKTRLADIGGMQRQVSWYERQGSAAARANGWRPLRTATWLIGLASDELDQAIRRERELFASEFSARAGAMLALVSGSEPAGRGLALVDPRSKRRDWLIRTRLDGRRSPLPYRDYAEAARRLTAR